MDTAITGPAQGVFVSGPADSRPGFVQRAEVTARLAETIFAEPVIRITAPGGRRRDSVRVHFADWTLIASHRGDAARLRREAEFLGRLTDSGAPVPRLLAVQDGVLFQSDLGSTRFTSALARASRAEAEALAAKAFASLWSIKETVKRAGLLPQVPPVGTAEAYLKRLAGRPVRLAGDMGLDAPDLDVDELVRRLQVIAGHFIKWDARPGNAALDADGRACWFDWEDFGRRGGYEDFAFLIADEFWTLDAEHSLAVFKASTRLEPESSTAQLARFATLCAAQRLAYMRGQWLEHGWTDAATAKRYDRVGTVPGLIEPLCARGAAFAQIDPATRPLARWFRASADPELWQKTK